jgi:hypothetical protein
MKKTLDYNDDLYYCPSDVITITPHDHAKTNQIPLLRELIASPVATTAPPSILRHPCKYSPTSKDKQLESKLWLLRLGSPGVSQLDRLPADATGISSVFEHHPFCFIDFKAQAGIRKQAAQRSAVRTIEWKQRFYMDFGFMRASTSNLSHADKSKDCMEFSYNGFSSYLLMVDEASHCIWVFLTKSKDPPIDMYQYSSVDMA